MARSTRSTSASVRVDEPPAYKEIEWVSSVTTPMTERLGAS